MKLVTDVITEPITKAQIKTHLRIDSATLAEDLTTYQSIVPGSQSIVASYGLIGAGVDVLGKIAIVNFSAGTCNGTVNVKIQESDDNTTYADWATGSFTQVTSANDNAIQEKQYTGTKQYIRVVATVAVAISDFGVDIIVDSGATDEDTFLDTLITIAREHAEDYTGHALAPQTWDYYLNDFPEDDKIEWPLAPLTNVTGLYYKDSDGDSTTATENTDYIVDVDTWPGMIHLPYGETWPNFVPYPYNAVRIRGVCGYTGTAPYILPKNIYHGMLIHIGLLYKYRDEEIPDKEMKTVYNLYGLRRDSRRWF